MTDEKPREIAARVLADPSGSYIEVLLERALARSQLKPEDRRFLQELVYGVVRWQLTLDWLIEQKTANRTQKPMVRNLLRLALYQMFWLDRVPSYAAVNETVEIAKKNGLLQQAKFINAVLRGFGREADETRARLKLQRDTNPAVGFSHPEWLCRRWSDRYGKEKALRLLDWNNTQPDNYARLNTLKCGHEALLAAWADEQVEYEPVSSTVLNWVPPNTVFKLLKHASVATLKSFIDGLFYIQDPSTLLSVEMLDAKPGECVLDLCAAPGGKATYIAQKMGNAGSVVAEDIAPGRLQMVTENAQRLGATSVTTAPPRPGQLFDRVLIDAPCSNTGVMRRRVELRWRIQPDEIHRLAAAQLELLHAASSRLRPGGVLVYSTCSLEPEENSAVVREFVVKHPEFQLERERELSPMEHGTDGAYCARLTRSST